MNYIVRTTLLFMFSLFAVLPGSAAAQAKTETTTFQVNVTTPSGNAIIGAVVIERTCAATQTTSGLTFNGMINGNPRTYTANVVERWLGSGREEVEVLSHNWGGTVFGGAVPTTFPVVQTSPGLVTVAGIPMAVAQPLQAPCSGQLSNTVTMAGQGTTRITMLPNTAGEGLIFHPLVLTALLIGGGCGMIVLSRLLRDPRMPRVTHSQGQGA